jgi:hypothetical protein
MHQQLWGYKVEEKLYVRVHEQRRLYTTALWHSYDTNPLSVFSWSEVSFFSVSFGSLRSLYSNRSVDQYSCLCACLHVKTREKVNEFSRIWRTLRKTVLPLQFSIRSDNSKGTGAWSWTVTSIWRRGSECVELYFSFPYALLRVS